MKFDFWGTSESRVEKEVDTPPPASSAVEAREWLWGTPERTTDQAQPACQLWHDIVRLPEFVPGAAENPFLAPRSFPKEQTLAFKRARWLVSLLDVPEQRRRARYLRFFEEVFAEFPHANTYRVLTNLVIDEDPNPELFVEACKFKLSFLEKAEWLGRQRGRGKTSSSMLGWREAMRLTEACQGDPTTIIDDDWLTNWLDLPPSDRDGFRFFDYVASRVSLFQEGIWEPIKFDRAIDRDHDWKRRHGLSGASDFARTASLIGLRSAFDEYRPK